jgi:hypothetical protein
VVEQHARAQARSADLVDRLGGDLLRNPGLDLGLAGGDLALPGLQHLADDHVFDLLGLDLRPFERGRHREAAEFGGVERREAATHLADRGAGGAEDHGLWHESFRPIAVACAADGWWRW